MQTVADLIDAARKALSVSSDAEFARRLGVSRGTISNWKSGYSLPDTVMCATLAGLTGLPLARVLGIVGEARAVSREEKAVWRKLAATAMALCLAVGFALPHKAHAAATGFDKAAVYTLCEMTYLPWSGSSALHGNGCGSGDEAGKSVTQRHVKVLLVRRRAPVASGCRGQPALVASLARPFRVGTSPPKLGQALVVAAATVL
jgi:transcriptional regulator with XRE-family HTH domain